MADFRVVLRNLIVVVFYSISVKALLDPSLAPRNLPDDGSTSNIYMGGNDQSIEATSQSSKNDKLIEVPFTMAYVPVSDYLVAADFSEVAALSCAYMEKFVADVFSLAKAVVAMIGVFCLPLTPVFNTAVGYKIYVLISEGSTVVPSQADVETIVCAALSPDEIYSLAITLPDSLTVSTMSCDQALSPISDQSKSDTQPASTTSPSTKAPSIWRTSSPTNYPTISFLTSDPTESPTQGPTPEPSHSPTSGTAIRTTISSTFSNVNGSPSIADINEVVDAICSHVLEVIDRTFALMSTTIVLEHIMCSRVNSESPPFAVAYEIYVAFDRTSAFVPSHQDIVSLACFAISSSNINSISDSLSTNNPFVSATNVTCDQNWIAPVRTPFPASRQTTAPVALPTNNPGPKPSNQSITITNVPTTSTSQKSGIVIVSTYSPIFKDPTLSDFNEAASLTCNYLENFLREFFLALAASLNVVNVFCVPVSTKIDPVEIGYELSIIFTEVSTPIPSPADIESLIFIALSPPNDASLLSNFNSLSEVHPFANVTTISCAAS
jgi:hypothetical protein